MLSASFSLSPSALQTALLASPPPPFSTSSSVVNSAFSFFLRHTAGGGVRAPTLNQKKTVVTRFERQNTLNVKHPLPVLQLDSDQSPRWGMRKDCTQSPHCQIESGYESHVKFQGAFRDSLDLGPQVQPFFQAATGVGLGLSIPIPREYVLSFRSDEEVVSETLPRSAASSLFDALSAFFDDMHGLADVESPSVPPCSPPPQRQPPAVILPQLLSPVQTAAKPEPPTPEDAHYERHFLVYRHPDRPARPRPHPDALIGGMGEDLSPVLAYQVSRGTTPPRRHGWDPVESFNASLRRPFRPPPNPYATPPTPAPETPVTPLVPSGLTWSTWENMYPPSTKKYRPKHERPGNAPAPPLPWLRKCVKKAPYTRLPRSPVLPSCISHSPRPENHHGQVNRYKSEVVRRRLMRLEFREPLWFGGAAPVLTPEETTAKRRRRLAREESAVEVGRGKWWKMKERRSE
ncbi:hypothetical protein FB45DRAFT_1059440 [Roridomyces roridus]|uniref:Uncharacterized protein n=1 Tax=Roridomyces roridus TaxID=1738132 RepID=A0AAD7FK51_9AGAR|nr:hypothetical protein FB45DRAFT_1059440 [Roridomyces roridus]